MKTFSIGNDRILKLEKNDEIRILDKSTKKEAVLTPGRWASFLRRLDEIDNELCKLTQGEHIACRIHYGGGWHVSLTKGFRCIEIRKFYVPLGETTIKPTKTAIAGLIHERGMGGGHTESRTRVSNLFFFSFINDKNAHPHNYIHQQREFTY